MESLVADSLLGLLSSVVMGSYMLEYVDVKQQIIYTTVNFISVTIHSMTAAIEPYIHI